MPSRVAAFDDGSLAITMIAQPELFALADESGRVKRRAGVIEDLITNPPDNLIPFVVDGHLFPNLEHGFVLAPRYASYLFFYNNGAELVKRIALIDGYDFPNAELQENSTRASAKSLDKPHRTLFVSFTEDNMFVDTADKTDESAIRHILDRYDRSSGKYIDSMLMPENGKRYQVYGDMIYGVIADTTLTSYRFSLPN